MPVILLTNRYGREPYDVIRRIAPSGFTLKMPETGEREALLRAVREADYLLAGGRARIDRELLARSPHLKMVQRTGVGTDTLDLKALCERRIPVYVNQGVNAVSVAEHTVMLTLAVLRRVAEVDAELRTGIWRKQENGVRNRELYGKTVGLVGMGHVGQRTAKILSGFDVRLLYCSRHRKSAGLEQRLGLTWRPYEELLQESDVLVFLCALDEETRGMLGAAQIAQMREGSIVVNTARGPLIDGEALAEALRSGKLAGAGLDVFEKEPLQADNPFFQMKNVVLSPHIAGITKEAFQRMIQGAMENIALFEEGNWEKLEHARLKRGTV